MSSSSIAVPNTADFGRLFRGGAIAVFLGTLLWSPFPLGGAIRWAPGVQQILIAVSWVLWILGTARQPVVNRQYRRLVLLPTALFALALAWAVAQILPGVPQSWTHPVWGMAADVLGTTVQGTISLNPWRTAGEILNLASYVIAGGLVFAMARRIETARLLVSSIVAITALYALYAFVLAFADVQQVNVFYSVPYKNALMSGPFMLHNSFATYCGLGSLAALAKLTVDATRVVDGRHGVRRLVETSLQFCFGRGALVIIALVLTFAGVVASASRAGFVATLFGLLTMALVARIVSRAQTRRLAAIGAVVAALPILLIIVFNGDTLSSRLDQLLASDTADATRFALWASARRMIADAPLLGLGLGTFEDAYPMYAAQVFPNVMDKAHCDYLEFAAGIGLPAAIAWWGALVWLAGANFRAIFVRHRRREFAIVAVGASVLVAVHSAVDFSLQLPAVALLFTALLSIGAAQCLSSNQPNNFLQ